MHLQCAKNLVFLLASVFALNSCVLQQNLFKILKLKFLFNIMNSTAKRKNSTLTKKYYIILSYNKPF